MKNTPAVSLPPAVSSLLDQLHASGFSAYAVGGCVRDSLLGRTPKDWDLCTSALPDQMKTVFAGDRLVETGLQHGTLTVVRDHHPYEITTFRLDGVYSDHRHPDSVSFVPDLREDLARRDFTINAMAWSSGEGLVDYFHGREDLADGVIRCVGDPAARFREDALRMMRALRFASVYDFRIDPETEAALRTLAPSLRMVAAERIQAELIRLLCGQGAGRILRLYPDVLSVIIPDIAPMIGYDQNNHHHHYTLWEHTVQSVENIPPEPALRLTMLLHDTGKPESRTTDPAGESHFFGHHRASARIAARVTKELRFDRLTQERVTLLVDSHDIPLRDGSGRPNTDRSFLLRLLRQFGEKDLRALFLIHRADRISTGYSSVEKEDQRLLERTAALDALLAEHPCFSLDQLAVNGYDLQALGFHGREIGQGLNDALNAVIDSRVPNEKNALLELLSRRQQGQIPGEAE